MSATPTLTEAVHLALESKLREVHTCMPGRIEKYDASKQEAEVKPLLSRRLRDGTVLELPVLSSVPVIFPQAGGAFISLPVKPGDTVLLLFAERSIDEWLQDGGLVTPSNKRRHHISDAIAIPGLLSLNTGSGASVSDLLISFGTSTITITEGGDVNLVSGANHMNMSAAGDIELLSGQSNITITSGGEVKIKAGATVAIGTAADELIDLMDQLAQALATAVTATAIGPQPLSTAAQIAVIQAKLATMKGTL